MIRAYEEGGSGPGNRLPEAELSSRTSEPPPGAYEASRPSECRAALQDVSVGQDSIKAQLTDSLCVHADPMPGIGTSDAQLGEHRIEVRPTRGVEQVGRAPAV